MLRAVVFLLITFVLQLPVDESIRGLVDRYFDSFVRRDLPAYTALWDPSSPDLPGRRQAVEQLFATTTYSFTPPRISRVKVEGASATVWVSTRRTIMRGNSSFVTEVALALDLKSENGEWKIGREASAVAELARMLAAAAGNQTELNELLAIDPALLTRELVVLLHGESDRALSRKDYAKALDLNYLIQRVSNQTGLLGDEASAWRAIGDAHYYRREYPKGLEAYQKSLALEEGLRRDYDLMNLWMSMGLLLAAMEHHDEAIDAYSKGAALGEKVGDKVSAADALDRISKVHQDQGRFSDAIKVLAQALAIRETMFDRAAAAATLIRLAELEYDQGEADQAISYYQRSLAVYETLGRPDAETYALHNIANISYLQGNYDAALAMYRRELDRTKATDNPRASAAAQTGIGLILTIYGDYAGALVAYQSALEVWLRTTELAETASSHQKVGATYYRLGNFEAAERHYREELRLREALKEGEEIGWALLDVVSALNAEAKLDEAVAVNERSLSLFETSNNAAGIATALTTLSGVRYSRKEFDLSLSAADRAASTARLARDFDVYWQARHRAGKASVCLLQFDAARRAFLDAITTIESKYASLPVVRPQRLLEQRLAPFLAMVDLGISQNRGAEALVFAEKGKQLALRSILETQRLKINPTMTTDETSAQSAIARKLSTLSTQLYRERERTRDKKTPSSRLESLTAQINQTRSDETAFETDLYKRRPDVKALRAETPALSFRAIQGLVWPTEVAILEFVETEEQIYLFVLTRAGRSKTSLTRIQVYPLGVSRGDVFERVMGLARAAATRADGWQSDARWLYDVLIKPAETAIAGRTELIVIPDGVAWNIPFGALMPNESEFLIERCALSMATSITALERSERESRRRMKLPGPNVTQITEYKQNSTINDASPFFSVIEGKELRTYLDSGINSKMLVLSSSELTPRGVSAGRGLIGFWWILMIARCDSSLAGRWQSDTEALTLLLTSFKTQGANRAALQNATKALLMKPEYRHPFFWAGLVLAEPLSASFR